MTGDLNYIRRIGTDIFQVAVEEETHSDRVIVFDRSGTVRGAFRSTKPEEYQQLTQLIEQLLSETSDDPTDVTPPVGTAEPGLDSTTEARRHGAERIEYDTSVPNLSS